MKKSGKAFIMLIIFTLIMQFSACRKTDLSKTGTSRKSSTVSAKATGMVTTKASGTKAATATSKTAGNVSDNGEEIIPGEETEGDAEEGGENQNAPEEEIIHLGGLVIKVAARGINDLPSPDTPILHQRINYKNMLKAEETYHCKFEFVDNTVTIHWQKYQESIISGIPYVDVLIWGFQQVFPYFMKANAIFALDEYIDFNNSPAWNNAQKDIMLYKGRRYGLPTVWGYGTYCMFYNKNLLEKEGYPRDLSPYFYNNSWTWDKMLEIASTVTKDFNGDGLIDQYGICSTASSAISLPLIYSNGGNVIDIAGDRYTYALNQQASVRPLNFVSDLYNIYRVITPDLNMWKQGKAILLCTGANQTTISQVDFTCGIMPFPRSPTYEGWNDRKPANPVYMFSTFIPEGNRKGIVKAMGKVAAYWDETNEEYMGVKQFFHDVALTWPYINLKGESLSETDLSVFVEINEKSKFCLDNTFPPFLAQLNALVLNKIIQRETSVVSAIEAGAPVLQNIIDSQL